MNRVGSIFYLNTLAAFLVAAGVMFPLVWFLVLPGLTLFMFLPTNRIRTASGAFLAGLWFGFITAGAGIIWFWDTLPLDFLGIESVFAQRVGVGMTWAYISFGLAIPVAMGSVVLRLVRGNRFFPLLAGFIWVAVEIGRMWMFAVFTWSPKSLFGPHFSPAAIGYPLAENMLLLQLARPFGLDALNFLVAATAGVVLCMALPPHRGRRVLIAAQGLAAILVLTLFAGIGKAGDKHAATTGTMRIAILSDNYDFSTSLYDADAVITQLLARASAITPPVEVVLFPEEISLTSVFWAEKDATEFLYRLFGDREVLLLHTRSDQYPQDEEVDEDEVKSLSFESTTRGIIGRYDKQMLMPLGEYVPAFAQLFYSVIRDPDIEAHLEYIDRIALTQKMPEAIAFRGVRFGGLLCSDMLSPVLYRHLARKERADILVNLSNQFWFHGSPRLHHKSLQMARVHAVSHGLPLLVANNMAPSYAIDRHGRVIAETRWGQSDVLIVDMAVPRP